MSGREAPPPVPWRPDGEGWDTYQLGDVRRREGWELGAIKGTDRTMRLAHHAEFGPLPDTRIVYARPIPEPPIQVGDRVVGLDFDVPCEVVFQQHGVSVLSTGGDLLIRPTVNLLRAEPRP